MLGHMQLQSFMRFLFVTCLAQQRQLFHGSSREPCPPPGSHEVSGLVANKLAGTAARYERQGRTREAFHSFLTSQHYPMAPIHQPALSYGSHAPLDY